MTKFWMAVASKNHVKNGVKGSFAQACHGKAQPLKKMKVNDGIIYYSPKQEFKGSASCQQFTAIGRVSGEEVYQFDMGNGFTPFRRDVKYTDLKPVDIKPLISKLLFIKDKKRWGAKFRFGFFEIPKADFETIEDEMLDQTNISKSATK